MDESSDMIVGGHVGTPLLILNHFSRVAIAGF